jgi:hypothetical protein
MSQENANDGRLIAASCTTGWLDWIHGELWLLPDGLLRISTSLVNTAGNGILRTIPHEPVVRQFTHEEIDDVVARRKRNLWIPAEEIASVKIHTGLLQSRANLSLADGRRQKLLWLRGPLAEHWLRRGETVAGGTGADSGRGSSTTPWRPSAPQRAMHRRIADFAQSGLGPGSDSNGSA